VNHFHFTAGLHHTSYRQLNGIRDFCKDTLAEGAIR
jgi:hypothetical protein